MLRFALILACTLFGLAGSSARLEAQEWADCPRTLSGGGFSGTLIADRWRSTWIWEQRGNPWESSYWAGFVEHRHREGVYALTGGGRAVVACGTLTLI
ncbi:MAG: hypothetical protein R3E98_03865 [Gemmatimonadota bacterium]|nr:hypothetical protein [Gemmatimonadota bacterium]